MSITTVFLLFGGLGLFLYGMKLMSEGLEQVAGSRMRSILEVFTKNRFIGMIVGIIFTGIIQSSNATTVMVVSFVNSGLMNLYQAAGVILGANIGTTITGQLVAFNLSEIAPLFVIIGVLMMMLCKKQMVQKTGGVVLGFGILFMGLSTMGNAMTSLKELPEVIHLLQSLSNPLAGILLGFLVTAVLQSSSATVGVIILMASQGLIHFNICFFLILGCNIGSCVSAMVASLGGNKDAKRAAWIHLLFNLVGSALIFLILIFGLRPISETIMQISGQNAGRAVANTHSLIKVFEVIMLFPFMGWIVKLTYRIIPGKDASPEDAYQLQYIGERTILRPTTAVVNGIQEIRCMGEIAKENLIRSMEALYTLDEDKIQKVYEQEGYIDFLNQKITNYLVKINELELPHADALLIGGLFHVVNDIERIGDHAENFADSAKQRINHQVEFSEKGIRQLREMTSMVVQTLDYALEMFSNKSQEHMQEVVELENSVDEMEKKLQKLHVKRLAKGKCSPEAGMVFSDTISGLERVADHATNIAFAILEPENHEINDDEEEENEE
ncbi:MAG: Na/Pi cotransporter family protein [Hespellia sp.]|nr:Na/Pi cotransporter family protein [Hespellia sp.]